MPDLYFKVGVINGKATLQEMQTLDGTYRKVGSSGVAAFQKGEKAASLFGGTLKSVKSIAAGLGLTFGGLLIAREIGSWVSAAIEFDKEFANVTTLLDTATVNTEAMKREIKDLNANLGSSAQLTKGLYQALSAGVEPAKAVRFVGESAKFAKAALTDTFTAVDIMTTILNAYSMSADKAGIVSDQLFEIIKQGKTTGAELAASLGPAIPTAASLSVNLEEVGAAIATLTKGGFNTATAVTSLNAAMLNFLSPTKQALEVAEKYNIELSAQAIQQKGLAGALGEMAEKVQGDAEAVAALFPNIRALRAALALTGKQSEEYNRILEAMGDTAGNTDEAFRKQMKTISAQWNTAMTNVEKKMEDIVLKTGPGLVHILESINDLFVNGIDPLNDYTIALGALVATVAGFKIHGMVTGLIAVAKASQTIQVFRMVTGFKDLGAAISLSAGSLGKFGQAGLVVGTFIATYSLAKWIVEATGLDKALGNLLYKWGLFKGRVEEATKGAEAATLKAADALRDNYGPELEQLGLSVDRNGDSLDAWAIRLADVQKKVFALRPDLKKVSDETANLEEKAGGAGEKVKQLSEEVKKLQEQTRAAAHPVATLLKKFDDFMGGGVTKQDATDFIRAYSSEIIEAANNAALFGEKITPQLQRLAEQARAFEDAREKAEQLRETEERLKEINEKDLPQAIANLTNDSIKPNAKALVDLVAKNALAAGKVGNLAEAYEYALQWLDKYDQMVSQNNENVRQQAEAFQESLTYAHRIGEAYKTLGISADKSLSELEQAFFKLQKDGMQSERIMTEAMSKVVSTAVAQGQEISDAMLVALDDMASSTDITVREKMLPVWMEYYDSLRDANGQYPDEYVEKLLFVMSSTDDALKKEMLPAWQKYIESIKKIYGELPPDLEKINEKIVKDTGEKTDEMGDLFKNQVSTIVTDWSKAIADMVFDTKGGTNKILDTLKEFGKMALRTLLEGFMNPLRKEMGNLISDIVGALSGSASGKGSFGDILKGGSSDWIKQLTSEEGGSWFNKMFQAKEGGGVGGIGGSVMKAGGMMMAMDSLGRGGWGGVAEGALGGGMAGYAQYGAKGGWGGAMTGGGMNLFMQGMKQEGAAGWGKAIGGGALTGAGIGTMIMPGIGTAIGAGIGAIGGAVAKFGSWIGNAITGKNAWEAGAPEVARDFGGVTVDQGQLTDYLQGQGWTESELYHRRKNVLSSPKFLAEVTYPLAVAQGKVDQFLQSLEAVGTSWGNFNFRDAFEEGVLTDNWEALNQAWEDSGMATDESNAHIQDLFDNLKIGGVSALDAAKQFMKFYEVMKEGGRASQEFVAYIEENREVLENYAETSDFFAGKLAEVDQVLLNMEEHAERLAELDEQAFGFQQLYSSLEAIEPVGNTAIDTFLRAGIVTEAFKEQIEELGGDVDAIVEAGGLMKLNAYFGQLVDHFRQTGEVAPDLIKILQEYGGTDITYKAEQLSKLNATSNDITNFIGQMNALVQETTGLQDVMEGMWDDNVIQKLFEQGLDPQMFEGIAKLTKGIKDWDNAIAEFQRTGRLTEGGVPDIAREIMERAGLTSEQLDRVEGMFRDTKKELTDSGQIITDMLLRYGGEEGRRAVERMDSGFTAISSSLLEQTRSTMEEAYRMEREDLLGYLNQAQDNIATRASEITQQIEEEFTLVSSRISDLFTDARETALEEIDAILAKLKELNDEIVFAMPEAGASGATATGSSANVNQILEVLTGALSPLLQNLFGVQGAATGAFVQSSGLLRVHSGEEVRPARITRGQHSTGDTYIFQNNAPSYGINDLKSKVNQWIKDTKRRGGYQGVISR